MKIRLSLKKSSHSEIFSCSPLRFYEQGGWRMVSDWLADAINKSNWPLTKFVLEILNMSPISLDRLQLFDSNMVKQVKVLASSCPDDGEFIDSSPCVFDTLCVIHIFKYMIVLHC